MPDNASRRGAVDLGMPLMILAFLVIIGFMYWLNVQAAADKASRVIEEMPEEEVVEEMAGIPLADVTAIGTDPATFEGEVVSGVGYSVASLFGTAGFWVETASGNPFLVVYGDELGASGVSVAQGDVVSVSGALVAMQMSLLDEWLAAGGITENDKIIGEFATHFIAADQVTVSGGATEGGAGD
jgi:cbb3-type cytochrome oxidase subunit 3